MRLFGLDVQFAPATSGATVPAKGSVGIDGDSPFADIQAGGFDQTPEMSGLRKWKTIEEMRKTDSMVRSILYMYKLPLRSADWGLEAAEDDPDGVVRDTVAYQFGLEDYEGQLDLTWSDWLSQSMLFFDFGCMFEELVWADELALWDIGDGRPPVLVRPIARCAPRFPSSIDDIKSDTKTGLIISVRQGYAPRAPTIPGEKILPYVHEREGLNWWGTSLLRAMYGPWRLKKSLLIAAAIGWDRYSSGVPVVRYPKGSGGNDKREAERLARSYRTHERAWLVLEGTEAEGWKIDIVSGNQTLADPTPLIAMYNEEMAAAGLQMFSRLGTTKTGSRAVGEILADPFYLAIQSYAKQIAGLRMRYAFRRFVDVNFGTQVKTPTLSVSKIQARNLLNLAQAIYYLAQAGLNFTDRDTQDDIRDQMDLRHLPEPVQAVVAELPDDIGVEETSTADDPYNVPPLDTAAPPALAASYSPREGDSLGL